MVKLGQLRRWKEPMDTGIFIVARKHGPYDEDMYTWLYDILEDGEIRECWTPQLLDDLSESISD